MTDETNVTETEKNKFFIYGGLIIHADQLHELTRRIEIIRVEAGLKPGDPLKFDTNSRPDHVSVPSYTAAKDKVVSACAEMKLDFLAYMISHKIATESKETLVGFGLNTVVSQFNFKYLREKGDHGIVVVDRLPFKLDYDFLKGKFCVGLIMEDGRTARLDRIDLFASSCDGASHLSSAVDIVLGAFRYCINQTGDTTVPKKLFPRVAGMLWYRKFEGVHYIREYGLTLRPKQVKWPAYKEEYDAIVQHMSELITEDEENN